MSGLKTNLSTSMTVIIACGVIWNFLIDEKDVTNEKIREMIIFDANQDFIQSRDTAGFVKRKALIESKSNN